MDSKKYQETLALSTLLMRPKSPAGKYSHGGQEVSYDSLNSVLQADLQALVGSNALWRDNKNTLFSLIEETLTRVTPKNVLDTFGLFADVQTVPQGSKYTFTRKLSTSRGKQFVTRVGLAGRYETFELGTEKFDVQTTAYGGAARFSFEEFLDGRVQWNDFLSVINEGMSEAVYKEISFALRNAIDSFPNANKVKAGSFDQSQFERLLSTVSAYGTPTIYCTLEAAMTLIPANEWTSDSMKAELWANGYFTKYRGSIPVVVLPQSFTDETNSEKVIDPSYLYIMPAGGGKPVTIVFEGTTQVRSFDNRDWSTELSTYQKFGVGVMTSHDLAAYRNTSLVVDNATPDGFLYS